MKQKIVLIMITALVAATGTVMAQIPNYVPTNGLVGWWPFNGNANDESGNGNNGTVNGATLTTDRNGQVNKAYSFDGINDYIICSNSNIPTTTNVSISVWIKPFQNNGIAEFICLGSPTSTTWGTLAGTNWNGSPYQTLNYGRGCSGSGVSNVAVSPILNNWQHITYVSSGVGGICNVYVNGILVGQSNNGTIGSCTSTNLYFGVDIFSVSEYYLGELDDIGIWNRALTQQEITNLYNSTNCTTPSATITAGGPTTFCQGGSVTLTANGGGTYAWSNGLGSNAGITVSNSGTYTVTVTNGNCTATASQSVTVNPLPTVNMSALPQYVSNNSGAITLSGTPSGGTFAGSGVSGTQFQPSAAGLGSKKVTYTYTNSNNCTNSSSSNTIVYDTTGAVCGTYDTLYMRITVTSATPPNNISNMKVYPNPATNHLIVDNGNFGIMTGYSVKIISPLGQVVFNQPITQPLFDIDVSAWATGTYILQVLDPQQNIKARKNVVLQ